MIRECCVYIIYVIFYNNVCFIFTITKNITTTTYFWISWTIFLLQFYAKLLQSSWNISLLQRIVNKNLGLKERGDKLSLDAAGPTSNYRSGNFYSNAGYVSWCIQKSFKVSQGNFWIIHSDFLETVWFIFASVLRNIE